MDWTVIGLIALTAIVTAFHGEAVMVAVISAISVIVVALIGRGIFDRRALDKRIGKPNGRGTITDMSESALDKLEKLTEDVSNMRRDSTEDSTNFKLALGALSIELAAARQLTAKVDRLAARVAVLESIAERCSQTSGTFAAPRPATPPPLNGPPAS